MNVRGALPSDSPAVRDVARRSLQASYSLGPEAITSAVAEWYDEDGLDDAIDDDRRRFLVATVDDQVVAFSESDIDGEAATLLWLHVDPAYRSRDIGSTLFEATRRRLADDGIEHLEGRVLADNTEGTSFYEDHGFERTARETVQIAGRTYEEYVYVETTGVGREVLRDDAGNTVFVDVEVSEPGSSGGFHPVFAAEEGEDRYGYYCKNCDSLANAMDAMGRIECDDCGNVRKATRWDAAYL